MKLIFHIDYRTNWGESVRISGDFAEAGRTETLSLSPEGFDRWSCTVETADAARPLHYRYSIVRDGKTIREEWGHGHIFCATAGTKEAEIYDRWHDRPADAPFYSSAFLGCINRRTGRKALPTTAHQASTLLEVEAPMTCHDCTLVLCGSCDILGAWNPARGIRMSDADFPVWKVSVPSSALSADTEFKFVVVNASTGETIAWESGDNRRMPAAPAPDTATVIAGLRFNSGMPHWRGAGMAIPVFSIRTEDDFGVGDFYDLIKLIDWAGEAGMSFIQVLPINDTTMSRSWLDSYPYNANSTFALHPMYLRLEAVGVLNDVDRREYYRELGRSLNSRPTVDFDAVNKGKEEYLREIFAQDGDATAEISEYKSFIERNGHWLMPYAAFCVLRDRFGTSEFQKWGEYAVYSPQMLARVQAESPREIAYNCFVQYHLDRQMTHVHNYASAAGVALKGDVPIGISRSSADAWQDPRLFNLDCQAGAPPDAFSVLGQNWGFPTYNWDEMSKDGFKWWKSRFDKMAEYFDAYRIDHILGFFRIWEIPTDAVHGLLGYFNPALPFSPDELRTQYDFWIDPEAHTRPFIRDYFLDEVFGEYKDDAVSDYLDALGDGRYALRQEVGTQRRIADTFAGLPDDDRNRHLREGLLSLADEVLFIEDPRHKGLYHPRISAQSSHVYGSLNDYGRWCFDRLYEDFFYSRHNGFWRDSAMWKLPPLIAATDMLACGEDLGMIPTCVPEVMQRLEILALELQRMPKEYGVPFGDTRRYPYYSVCTTSTHDMDGIRSWWEEDSARSQAYYNDVLHIGGDAPATADPSICDRIISMHLESPSMLCILPLQDWLSADGSLRRSNPAEERINVPAESRHYWCYRMHLTVEDLMAHSDFSTFLRDRIANSGRDARPRPKR